MHRPACRNAPDIHNLFYGSTLPVAIAPVLRIHEHSFSALSSTALRSARVEGRDAQASSIHLTQAHHAQFVKWFPHHFSMCAKGYPGPWINARYPESFCARFPTAMAL